MNARALAVKVSPPEAEKLLKDYADQAMQMIWNIVHRCGLSIDDKDDLASDIFCELLADKIKKYNGQINLSIWITLVARQLMMNRIKKLKRNRAMVTIDDARSASIGDDVSHNMELADVKSLIEKEDNLQLKSMLLDRFWYGHTIVGIAKLHEVSPSYVHVKIRDWLVQKKFELLEKS